MQYPDAKPGDYIVGSYHDMGRELKPGKGIGDPDETMSLQEMILEHGQRTGGKPLSDKKITGKKGVKKKKVADPEPEMINIWDKVREEKVVEKSNEKKYIYLFNKLGKIRLSVETVLECEAAYCVVFRSEDDVIFTPNPGETLNMINLDGDEVTVYFANSMFNWIDGVKQLMILFKK